QEPLYEGLGAAGDSLSERLLEGAKPGRLVLAIVGDGPTAIGRLDDHKMDDVVARHMDPDACAALHRVDPDGQTTVSDRRRHRTASRREIPHSIEQAFPFESHSTAQSAPFWVFERFSSERPGCLVRCDQRRAGLVAFALP